jgi:defect in organelle trafficking protein DotC
MVRVRSLLASVSALAACLSACGQPNAANVATGNSPLVISNAPDIDLAPAAGRLQPNVPTLQDMETESAPLGSDVVPGNVIRDQAINEAALAYGARGGLAYASKRINAILNDERASLAATWNIGPLEIVGPSGTRILPPVITQRSDVYQQPDANTVQIADLQYEIVSPARFTPVVPLWQTYLIMSWAAPEKPDYSVYPKDEKERAIWKAGVAQGFQAGEQQGLNIFRNNINRLQRDYAGMTTWATLVSQGKATSPVVAAALQPVTGGGNKLTIGQGTIRLAEPAQLLANPANWTAPAAVAK